MQKVGILRMSTVNVMVSQMSKNQEILSFCPTVRVVVGPSYPVTLETCLELGLRWAARSTCARTRIFRRKCALGGWTSPGMANRSEKSDFLHFFTL